MPDKDCVVTIVTHFLSKTDKEIEYNLESSVVLTLRDHCKAERAAIKFMSAKV